MVSLSQLGVGQHICLKYPSISETVLNLKTYYELLRQKLKFEFVYLKKASDKVDLIDFVVDLEELYNIPSGINWLPPSQKQLI